MTEQDVSIVDDILRDKRTPEERMMCDIFYEASDVMSHLLKQNSGFNGFFFSGESYNDEIDRLANVAYDITIALRKKCGQLTP